MSGDMNSEFWRNLLILTAILVGVTSVFWIINGLMGNGGGAIFYIQACLAVLLLGLAKVYDLEGGANA